MQKKIIIGFSLIELMIVVTIISILAAIAIPSYQDYTKRARFAETIAAVEPFKIAVSLALQQGIPRAELRNGAHGIAAVPRSTKNLASIIVENAKITATATDIAGGDTLILTPDTNGGGWKMTGSCTKNGLCSN